MKPLTERMTKGGAAKAWINEVEAKDRTIDLLSQKIAEHLNIINLLACEKEQLEAENKRLRELPERIKRMCYVKEAWQADGALCDIEEYIDTLLESE